MRTFKDAVLAAQAAATPAVRDQVRDHLTDIREARKNDVQWAVIAQALAELGIQWKSGAPIGGAALCRMVGEIERLDYGIRRPVGRPGRKQLSAASRVQPHAERDGPAELRERVTSIALLRATVPASPDETGDAPAYESRLKDPLRPRSQAASPVERIKE